MVTKPRSLHARIKSTPSTHRTGAVSPGALQKVATRLRWVAYIYAFGYLLTVLIGDFTTYVLGQRPFTWQVTHYIAAFFIVDALGMGWFAGLGRFSPRALIRWGLLFEVTGSLGIALTCTPPLLLVNGEVWGIPWVCVWIVMYPLVVPAPPRQKIVAALLSASTIPLSILFWARVMDRPLLSLPDMVAVTVPGFICAAVAAFGAAMLHRMNADLDRARRMGSYRLEKLLGSGGMGEVWQASHQMLARPAAIKLIRPEALAGDEGTDDTAIKRFTREAQATAALSSPHTVDLYDFGVTEDGVFYYVMELLDGLDLESLVERYGSVCPERAVYFLSQACRSLAEAHHRGLIHRDIKPANIYACRQGLDHDVVKVLDFGLVKPSRSIGSGDSRLTRELEVTGTPAYLAPECALGHPVDARTDLYALGCVAYWLVTGQLVFEGRTPVEMIAHHLNSIPVAPSARTEMEVPDGLESIILQCLAKEPAKRPAGAGELLERLDQVAVRDRWTEERAGRWWTTHLPTPPFEEGAPGPTAPDHDGALAPPDQLIATRV